MNQNKILNSILIIVSLTYMLFQQLLLIHFHSVQQTAQLKVYPLFHKIKIYTHINFFTVSANTLINI